MFPRSEVVRAIGVSVISSVNSVLDLVREHYHDFGPTFACEKLLEKHDLPLGKETLRRWMMEAGIWKTRRERQKQIHQPRGRRDCFGELVLMAALFSPKRAT